MVRLLLLLALTLVSCGESEQEETETPPPLEQPEPTPTPEPQPEPPKTNPTCSGIMRFRNRTLWKPVADHNPNCVILISDRFPVEFRSCKAQLKNGKFERLNGTGFANGGRQHWRCLRRAGEYKRNAQVVCEDVDQQCVWQIKGSPNRRHE